MSKRGFWGLRKNGVDKITFTPYSPDPCEFGEIILIFCMHNTIEKLNTLYQLIELVDEEDTELHGNIRYDFNELINHIDDKENIKMYEFSKALKNSYFCECGYIINLDDEEIEFYAGNQKLPRLFNRYGEEPYDNSSTLKEGFIGTSDDGIYYPSACLLTIPLKGIKGTRYWVRDMNTALNENQKVMLDIIQRKFVMNFRENQMQ